ncbi:MAG: gluconokinase [Ferruginibacter sp.]
MDCIITIDIGLSAVRIFAFEMKGTIIGSMKGFYPTFHTQPDYSEQDPEHIFVTVLNLLRNILSENIHPDKYRVAAICFSGAMHSVLPVDKNGVPLGNAIVWADNRAKKEAAELKKSSLGKRIYNATGTPIHPMSLLAKIAWLRNNDKERFGNTYKFVSIKDYILQQLTGEYVIDHSLASSTGLLNIHTLEWNKESLEFTGINAGKLPKLVPVYYSKLIFHKQYCTNLGLPLKTKIIIGASDGCLATLGSGVWGKGKATITIDASGAVRVAGKKVLKDKKLRFFNYLLADGYFVSGGPTNNGGVVFEWFTRQFGTFLDSTDFEENVSSFFKEAAQVAPGSDGLIFLPYLLGERAPIWNANARGLYFGINIKHEQKHFVRATIEGILYEIYSIGKILEEHRLIDSLYVNGPFASLPLWAQIIANMFNKPVYVNDNHHSVGTGAFLLSLTGMGVYKNLEEASATIQFQHIFLPNENDHRVYMNYFAIFERLSIKLEEEFSQIALLQQLHK